MKQVFRVLEFDRAGTTIDDRGNVKAVDSFRPYGYLLVETPILNNRAKLPIIHRDDFLLASSVFDEPVLADFVKEIPSAPVGNVGFSENLVKTVQIRIWLTGVVKYKVWEQKPNHPLFRARLIS